MGSMGAVRCGFVALVFVFALLSRETVEVSPAELTIGSAAYLLHVLLTPWIVRPVREEASRVTATRWRSSRNRRGVRVPPVAEVTQQ
jgi:hypothetical protein